jgi:tetratricopeptide (TPR) repeat protein
MKKTLTIFLLFASIAAFSQTKNEKKGDDFYDIYYFDKAIKSYMHADSLSLVAQRNLAESFYNRFDFAQAEIEYEKFIESPLATINDYYTFILILKANENYDEVPYWMNKIAEKKSDDLRVKDFNETKQII